MKTNRTAQPKRKLPYLTEDDLNAPVKAMIIRVVGSYTKRGEQRKDVYEDDYEADIVVPESYNMGHVKLGINRYVKKELKGIRARTFNIDHDVEPRPADKPYRARDFISQQGLMDNESLTLEYVNKVKAAQARREAEESGNYAPPAFSDDTQYGRDGLPPVILGPAVGGD